MKKSLMLLPIIALALTACDRMDRPTTPKPDHTNDVGLNDTNLNNVPSNQNNSWFSDTSTERSFKDADNTGRNMRDTQRGALVSTDQSENEFDRKLTQKVRQFLTNDDELSTDAKNIKIITVNGKVTLKGPVANAQEKAEIARKAQSIEGIKAVDNQLEIVKDTTEFYN